MCETCGAEHDPRKCRGHVTRDREGNRVPPRPCGKFPMRGGVVCGAHGGLAPQVRAKARERAAEAQVARWAARQTVEPVTDPLGLLARVGGLAVLWMERTEQLMADLDPARWRYEDDKGGEQLRSEIALFERAMDRCHKHLREIAQLNIEERLVRVTEAQAKALLVVLLAAIDDPDWGLTREQRERGRAVAARHLPLDGTAP